MCPATMSDPPNSIGLYWTDEQLIMSLVRGPPFPDDVIDDFIPYNYEPSNLPVDSWFYVRSDLKKDSEYGSWKAKGEPSKIFSDSFVTGLRTTLEFYEGQAPHAQRTNWVMQEYGITQNGLDSNKNLKCSNLLCRVFLTSGTNANKSLQQKLDHAESAGGSYLHPKPSSFPELSTSQATRRGENNEPLGISGEHQHQSDCFAQGDYLELDDLDDHLVDLGSLSSNSNDTSCVTISSDACFDYLALLKDIDDDINKGKEGKGATFKYNVAVTAKPDEVVIQPVTVESLIGTSGNGSQSPNKAVEKRARDERVTENAVQTQNVSGKKNRSTSSSEDEVGSSSSGNSVSGGKKRLGRRLKMLSRKYMCSCLFNQF